MGKGLGPGELGHARCGDTDEPATDAAGRGRSLRGIFGEERQDLW
jgi:hypothetical protein